MAPPLGPPPSSIPPTDPLPKAVVTAEGKLCLCLGSVTREIRVKYGDEALTDTFQLEKMASLINKHYDTKKLYDELFTKPGNKLTLASGGITNMTGDKIAASAKGFKKGEEILTHHDRKLAELQASMKKSVEFGREVAKLGPKYPDAVLKQAISSITGQTGVDVKRALNGESVVSVPHARLFHAKQNEGLLTTLLALKNRPNLGTGNRGTVADCRKEILKLLKDNYGIELPETALTDTFKALAKAENITDARDKINTFLTDTLKVANVDEEFTPTQSISHYKLDNKEGNKTRLALISEKISGLKGEISNPAITDDQKQSIFMQLHTLRQMKELWELYRTSPAPSQQQVREAPTSQADLVLERDPDQPAAQPSVRSGPEAALQAQTGAARQEKPVTEPFRKVFEGFDQKSLKEKEQVLYDVVKSILTVDEIDIVLSKHFNLLTEPQKKQLNLQKEVRMLFEKLEKGDETEKRTCISKLVTLDLPVDDADDLLRRFRPLLTEEQDKALVEKFQTAIENSNSLERLDRYKPKILDLEPVSPFDTEEVTVDDETIVDESAEDVDESDLEKQQEGNNIGVVRSVINKIGNILPFRKPPQTPSS